MAEILIDTDILIDISWGVISTAQYLAQASATTTLSISSITQMELIVGCQDKQSLRLIARFLTRFQIIFLTPEIAK